MSDKYGKYVSICIAGNGSYNDCEPRRGEARNLDFAIGTLFFPISVCMFQFFSKTN